jgi:Predicted membrane protein
MTLQMMFLAYGLVVNLITFLVFAWDKRRAERDKRRIPERQLHTLTLIGGSLGAWLAIFRLRHKNRKFSFLIITILISVIHLGLAYLYFFHF